MSNNALQEILSKRFSRYTHATSPSVWEAIESQLDEKKSNRGAIWFWILNGLAASFFIGMIFLPNQEPLHVKFSSNLGAGRIKKIILTDGSNPAPNLSDQVAVTEQIIVKKDYKKFTCHSRLNGNKKTVKSADSSEPTQPKIDPSQRSISAPDFNPVFATKAVQPIDHFTRINQPLRENIAHLDQSFRPSIWAEIQSSYLLGIRHDEALPSLLDATPKPTLHRGFEFTIMSHVDLSPKFHIGIGLGYADAFHQTSETSEGTTFLAVKTVDYQQYNLVMPIQASYTLLGHRRIHVNAGIVLQPEFAQLSVRSETKITNYVSITGLESIALAESTLKRYQGFQFGIEPFAQVSLLIHPRISLNTNVGLRSYVKNVTLEEYAHEPHTNITFNLGFQYRIK